MKKLKFGTLLCYALAVAMLIPFGSMASNSDDAQFVAPDYKSYSAGGESTLELSLDYVPEEWFSITLTDTATGEVYVSNPIRYADSTKSASTEKNKTERSQLVVKYNFDENGSRDQLEDLGYVSSASKLGTYYSYDDCVVRDQIEITPLDVNGNEIKDETIVEKIKAGEELSDEQKAEIWGYKVVYGLGKINTEIYPQVLSEDALNEWVAKIVDENGNPNEAAQDKLRSKYYAVNMEKLEADKAKALKRAKTEADKKKVTEEQDMIIEDTMTLYPTIAEGGTVYVLYADATRVQLKTQELLNLWALAGLTRDDIVDMYAEIQFEDDGSNVNFFIPVIYMIEGNTFRCEIVTSEIITPAEVAITQIDFLPHFGAKTDESVEEGYTLVPDGSGAIIEHGSGDTRTTTVQIPISNRHKDEALSRTGNNISDIPYFEQSVLPVFGMKQDNRAIFAVIEKGYELANVAVALKDGTQNQYNYAFASFYPTATDNIFYSDGSSAGLTMFPKYSVETEVEIKTGKNKGTTEIQEWNYCRLPETGLQVRYSFLYDEKANYTGMANYFRQYLIDLYGMERLEAAENTTFYADIYGAIKKKISILGFPIEKKYALTTFEQAEEIVDELLKSVGNLSVRYMGIANGALYATDYSDHFRPLFVLGGKSGYSEFLSNMESIGVSVYPDVNPTHVYVDKTFDGFRPYYDAVKTLGKSASIIQNTNIATGLYATATGEEEEYYFPRWVVSPSIYEETFDNLKEALEVYGNKNISLAQVGSTLSADYNQTLIIDRTQTSRMISAILEDYENDGYSVSVEAGNYWTLPYVDIIMKIPTTSSKYIIEDYEIPFLQMVIHGMVEYTGEEINTVQDAQYQILKCLEYGCSLSARLMYEDDIVLQNTYYTTVLYSMNYRNWIDQIDSMYNTVNDILKDVQDQYIVAHERLTSNIYVTTYENGLTVAVNYNQEAATVAFNGTEFEIEGNGFVVLDKGD